MKVLVVLLVLRLHPSTPYPSVHRNTISDEEGKAVMRSGHIEGEEATTILPPASEPLTSRLITAASFLEAQQLAGSPEQKLQLQQSLQAFINGESSLPLPPPPPPPSRFTLDQLHLAQLRTSSAEEQLTLMKLMVNQIARYQVFPVSEETVLDPKTLYDLLLYLLIDDNTTTNAPPTEMTSTEVEESSNPTTSEELTTNMPLLKEFNTEESVGASDDVEMIIMMNYDTITTLDSNASEAAEETTDQATSGEPTDSSNGDEATAVSDNVETTTVSDNIETTTASDNAETTTTSGKDATTTASENVETTTAPDNVETTTVLETVTISESYASIIERYVAGSPQKQMKLEQCLQQSELLEVGEYTLVQLHQAQLRTSSPTEQLTLMQMMVNLMAGRRVYEVSENTVLYLLRDEPESTTSIEERTTQVTTTTNAPEDASTATDVTADATTADVTTADTQVSFDATTAKAIADDSMPDVSAADEVEDSESNAVTIDADETTTSVKDLSSETTEEPLADTTTTAGPQTTTIQVDVEVTEDNGPVTTTTESLKVEAATSRDVSELESTTTSEETEAPSVSILDPSLGEADRLAIIQRFLQAQLTAGSPAEKLQLQVTLQSFLNGKMVALPLPPPPAPTFTVLQLQQAQLRTSSAAEQLTLMQMMTNTMAGFRVYHVSEASVLYLLEETATTKEESSTDAMTTEDTTATASESGTSTNAPATTNAEETSTDVMTTEDYAATTATASDPAVNLN